MSDYRLVHDVLQQIDDDLIDEAMYAKKQVFSWRKFSSAAAIIIVCVFFSVGVAAAISPSFREGLLEPLQLKNSIELPKVEEQGEYQCYVSSSNAEKELMISLTEAEIEYVLDMIRESESEVMSEKNGNMEYADKTEIAIRLTTEYDNHEYTYVLAVAEENILTYSIEKISVLSGKVTEKNYVIYSKELYKLIMEKTIGGD